MANRKVAREGDSWEGTCYHPDHSNPISVTGVIIDGSSYFTNYGIGIARHGDRVQATCGHIDTIIATSFMTTNGIKVARNGDHTTGSVLDGVIIEGSPNFEST